MSLLSVSELSAAADSLRHGGVWAYPTEAVFGLGCDPANEAAVARVFAVKQRNVQQGFLLIAADFAQIEALIDWQAVPPAMQARIEASWPGPHTWIFPATQHLPRGVTGQHQGIAVRVTAHEPAIQLCRAFGGPLVSTSANPSGMPSARDAATVRAYFGERLDGVLDAPTGGLQAPSVIRDALTGAVIRA